MTIPTSNLEILQRMGDKLRLPMDAATQELFTGQLGAFDSTGYIVAAGDTAGHKFAGIFGENLGTSKDNDGSGADNADGDHQIYTWVRGRFVLTQDGNFTSQASVGAKAYVADSGGVTDRAGSTHSVLVGTVVEYVSATQVVVEIESQWIDAALDMIWVSPDGSSGGDGSFAKPYVLPSQAMAVASATRKTVMLMPGTYDEAEEIVWPLISGVKLVGMAGNFQTVISQSGAADDQVILVAPGAQSSTFEMWIENIYVDHAVAGLDGIHFNNTSMTKKLNCYLENVGGDADSDTDSFILCTQGDSGNAIRVYANGNNGGIEGRISTVAVNNGNRFYFNRMELNGGIVSGATALECLIKLTYCKIKHAGITGGNAAQHVNMTYCYTDVSNVQALADGDETAGSHTVSFEGP